MIASTVLLKKKPSRLQVIGILITLVGVVLTVIAVGATSSLSVFGYVFLLIAVVSYALYCVFVEKAAISKIGVNQASSFIGVATVISIVAGALLLKEPFSV